MREGIFRLRRRQVLGSDNQDERDDGDRQHGSNWNDHSRILLQIGQILLDLVLILVERRVVDGHGAELK